MLQSRETEMRFWKVMLKMTAKDICKHFVNEESWKNILSHRYQVATIHAVEKLKALAENSLKELPTKTKKEE